MNRKHILLLLISFLLLNLKTNAQANYEDVLYLKNGSILHGIIIEQVPNESIKIQTKDRNVFFFRMDEIQKITKEEIPKPVAKKREPLTAANIKKRGYTNITEICFGRDILSNGSNDALSINSYDEILPSLGVQTINGYLFNPYLFTGIGFGLHIYNDFSFVPVFADFRLNFYNGPVSPFISADIGYSFTGKEVYGINRDKIYFGGVYFNPSFGVKFNTRKSKGLAFSIGFRQQESKIFIADYYYNPQHNAKSGWGNYTIGYLVMKVGFIF